MRSHPNQRVRLGIRRGLMLTAMLAASLPQACGSQNEPGTAVKTTLHAATATDDACDPINVDVVADLLDVEISELNEGERYPSSDSCVFWSRVRPREFAVVHLDGSDSDQTWPCETDQVLEQRQAGSDGTPASVRACVAATHTATADVPSPPADLYVPPSPLDPAPPGTLIWAERVEILDLQPPATVWRILYHSRSRDNRDIAVSGFAVVPTTPLPADGRPVFAWAHGTVGLGDQCAPSHEIRDNLPPYGGQQIERGAVLVATDYEGLGTPGTPTSTVALAESHAVLDSVRAVAALPNVGKLGDVIVVGHSQGGRAALYSAEIATDYAPELVLVGAVALAPGVELPALVDHLTASPHLGVALIGAIGLRSGYPTLDLSTMFTSSAIADVEQVETECLDATNARYASTPALDVIGRAPATLPELQTLLQQNSPGTIASAVPVFMASGDADDQVPVDLSGRLESKYCALGVAVVRLVYPGQDHIGVIDAAAADAMAFINERFDRQPPPSTC